MPPKNINTLSSEAHYNKGSMKKDVIIIGAGAAGLMCAIESGKRGRSVLILDHAKKTGSKIRISGGGHCNFTNINASPDKYLSHNPHFCKSALSRFTPHDFIVMLENMASNITKKNPANYFAMKTLQRLLTCFTRNVRKPALKYA